MNHQQDRTVTNTAAPARLRARPASRLLMLLLGGLLLSLVPGCDQGPDERLQGPVSSFRIRNFKAPGAISQSLDPGGRALVFLELTNLENGTMNEIDPAWTFELKVTMPNGTEAVLLEDPKVPTAWANDEGVRLIGGFEASKRGNYQIEIVSENCPYGSAPMVLLPIN
jgi:hypothetical protein